VSPGPLYGYSAAALNSTFVLTGGFSGNRTADSLRPPGVVFQYNPASHAWVNYTAETGGSTLLLQQELGSFGFSATMALSSFPDISAGSVGGTVENRTMLIVGGMGIESA
jgi:hypothetical protein